MCLVNYSDKIYFYTHLGCGILSFSGSVYIIVLYIISKRTRVLTYRLVFYLTISQCIGTFEFLIPISFVDTNRVLCSIVGIITNSTQLISVVWMTYISITIYQVLAGKNLFFEQNSIFWSCLAWLGFPVLNVIPVITDTFRREGETCTYAQNTIGTIERVTIFYVPAWVLLSLTVYYYIRIFKMISEFQLGQTYIIILKRLMIYPIIMSINVILLTIIRMAAYFLNICDISMIDYFFYGIIGLNGFFNFIVFITTPGNKHQSCRFITNDSKPSLASDEDSSSLQQLDSID